MNRAALALLPLSALLGLLACGGAGGAGGAGATATSTGATASTTAGPGGQGTTSGSGGATTASTSGSGGEPLALDGGTGGSPPTVDAGVAYVIYASTDTDLYTLDPQDPTLKLEHIGTFDCITPGATTHFAMTDIAIDKDDNLWGVTGHDLVSLSIQGTTIHCGPFIPINPAQAGQTNPTFYALTSAPVGTIDPTKEVLVGGNSAGELWRIDVAGTTATTQMIGSSGAVPADDGRGHAYANAGKAWELSGDIVFLHNGGSPIGFATVRDCPSPPSTVGCSYTDTLLEIDMSKLAQTTGQDVTKAVRGQLTNCADPAKSFGAMYGIAAWADKVYGFAHGGLLVEVSNADGTSCFKGSYTGTKFSGAAVTTMAPVIAPPVVN